MPSLTNRKYSTKYGQTGSRWKASTFIQEQDSFGKEVPSFNLQGNTMIQTVFGGFCTLAILTLTLGYAITKFSDIVEGRNPNITQSTVFDYYGRSDELNLVHDTNFRLAFGFRWFNYEDDITLVNDPLNVRWLARLSTKQDGVLINTDLPLHDCNQEDFDQFYPLRNKDIDILADLTTGSNSSFKCLDWNDSLSIKPQNVQTIELILIECKELPIWQGFTQYKDVGNRSDD